MGNNKHEDKAALEALETRKAERLVLLLSRLWHPYFPARLSEVDIKEIRIRGPREDGGQIMVVVKASDEEGQYVGFHSADEAPEALKGALERIQNRKLNWKRDEYGGAFKGKAEQE